MMRSRPYLVDAHGMGVMLAAHVMPLLAVPVSVDGVACTLPIPGCGTPVAMLVTV